jgi:2',3'-cyclic-nucleotide 2'-phosphodiesterase (5'-nucleotidase family)
MHGRLIQSDSAIGLDTVAAIYNATPNSILVDAGDTFHGLPFVNFNQGANAVALMNAAGFSFMAPGNHDFNFGADVLFALGSSADFDILAANITLIATGEAPFTEYAIVEIDGVTVGFFGLAYPGTPSVTNLGVVDMLAFGNPVEAAARMVEALADVDVIIAIAHLGVDGDAWVLDVARAVPEIDVIIDGHSHTVLQDGYRVNDILIAQAGGHGEYLGVVEIVVYGGEVLSATASLIDREATEEITPVASITALIEEMQDALADVLEEVVAYSPITLFGDDPEHRPALRSSEVPIGNLIADSILSATGADISIINSGNIRYHIHEGYVTKGDILTILPWSNYVVVVEITAAQLWEVLELGVSAPGHGRFPQIGGFSFVFDSVADEGELRVSQITVNGVNIGRNDTTTFSLAINDFLAEGGDGYDMFPAMPVILEGDTLEDILIAFMLENDISGYAVEGRIVDAPADPMGAPTYRYVNGVPFVQVRELVEARSGTVSWDSAARTVTITSPAGNAFSFEVGYRNSFIDASIGRVFISYEHAVSIFQ